MRHFRVAKKLIAPGLLAVTGVSMQDAHVGGVRGIFKEIEPIVFGVTHRLDLPLAAALDERRIVRQRRRIVLVRTHIGEE